LLQLFGEVLLQPLVLLDLDGDVLSLHVEQREVVKVEDLELLYNGSSRGYAR
jgi:hypothetical protein